MNHFTGIIGICALLGIAYLLSENKKAINYRTVMWGLVLQFVFAVLILKTPIGKPLFSYVDGIINRLIILRIFFSFLPPNLLCRLEL